MGRGKRGERLVGAPASGAAAREVIIVAVAEIERESKVDAARVRRETIMPALAEGREVVLDFQGLDMVTQGFCHSLFAECLQKDGAEALDQLVFRNCQPMPRTIVETVIDYTLAGR